MIIEELVKPVSLSLRLFANMFGEKTVVAALLLYVSLVAPDPCDGFRDNYGRYPSPGFFFVDSGIYQLLLSKDIKRN
ncbi:MAG: F0F1 ATP synthase subunit A [Dethiobacteria bacterium]